MHVGRCHVFDKRLENVSRSHECAVSFVHPILVVSYYRYVIYGVRHAFFFAYSFVCTMGIIVKRVRSFQVLARVTEMVVGEGSVGRGERYIGTIGESKWKRGLKRKKKYIRETFGNDYSPCPLRFPITSYVMRIDNTSGNSFTSETERRDG